MLPRHPNFIIPDKFYELWLMTHSEGLRIFKATNHRYSVFQLDLWLNHKNS